MRVGAGRRQTYPHILMVPISEAEIVALHQIRVIAHFFQQIDPSRLPLRDESWVGARRRIIGQDES